MCWTMFAVYVILTKINIVYDSNNYIWYNFEDKVYVFNISSTDSSIHCIFTSDILRDYIILRHCIQPLIQCLFKTPMPKVRNFMVTFGNLIILSINIFFEQLHSSRAAFVFIFFINPFFRKGSRIYKGYCRIHYIYVFFTAGINLIISSPFIYFC